MLLCDVGNTNVNFYEDKRVWKAGAKQRDIFPTDQVFYYISVNKKISDALENKKNAINLESYFDLDTAYEGLGIDRIAACSAVKEGMIVDAGSAITVDIMSSGVHLGGFIMPGLLSIENNFATISEKLKCRLNPHVDLDILPQNTKDALSYGAIKPLLMILKESCKGKRIYFTGGDGKFFSRFFENSIFHDTLVFQGMLKVLKKGGIC